METRRRVYEGSKLQRLGLEADTTTSYLFYL
jgi:hypothetical protein